MKHYVNVYNSLEFIEQNLDDKIDIGNLSKKIYLSKYYYHKIFHKITGESLAKYITKRRMIKAAEELVESDQAIIDIALKYQYSSQESFSRAFLRIYGLTPGKYRKMYSKTFSNLDDARHSYKRITNMAA